MSKYPPKENKNEASGFIKSFSESVSNHTKKMFGYKDKSDTKVDSNKKWVIKNSQQNVL